MSYTAVHILCPPDLEENLSFLLNDAGYDGTAYENEKLTAYCQNEVFDDQKITDLLNLFDITEFEKEELEDKNWNKVWEENFTNSDINENLHVRAPFHPAKDVKHDIIILPKMAFGTGHHATTQLAAIALEKMDCENKSVLDMGCGSGLLAILASQKNAKRVVAIDYDINSVNNARENMQLNQINNVEVLQADNVTQLTEKFDIIVSNIIKSINLRLLPNLVAKLKPGGSLILSGFLEEDLYELIAATTEQNLKLLTYNTQDSWLQAHLVA